MLEGFLYGLGALLAFWGGWCLIAASMSGWLSWAKVYACRERPLEGDVLAPFCLAFRPPIFFFQYPLAVRVGASAQGLHLRTNFTFPVLHGSLRVPWSDVSVSEHEFLFFRFFGFEFAEVGGTKLFVGARAYATLRRKARLYWDPVNGPAREAGSLDASPSPFAPSTDEVEEAPAPDAALSPYTGAGSPLRLPADGGAIGPARVDAAAVSLGGTPGRLAMAALAAVLFVGMLNRVGVFAGDELPAQADDAQLVGLEVEPGGSGEAGGWAEPVAQGPEGLARSDDACPVDTFRTGDRPPAGREIYCVHAQEALRHGPFVAWYDDGSPKAHGEYRMGRRHGTWLKFDAQGRVQVEAEFADDRKHGWLRVFAEDGSLRSESRWEHGRRVS
ncbi:MAG: toxin-antitoxin system YwqK family antitoxin [Myxococcota bacterium]